MIIRHPVATLNILALLVAALAAGNVVLRPWLPAVGWETVAPVLACPFLMPPECVEPIPGL